MTPILRIVRDAATTDPDMADQSHVDRQQHRTAHSLLARHLAARDALRPDISVERATNVLYALISPELYVLLTTDCGWTLDRLAGVGDEGGPRRRGAGEAELNRTGGHRLRRQAKDMATHDDARRAARSRFGEPPRQRRTER